MDVVSFAWSRAVALKPIINRRSGVIGLVSAGNPENDWHQSRWQEPVGHGIIPEHTSTVATTGLFVMLLQKARGPRRPPVFQSTDSGYRTFSATR
jgi:hypothetical protein